MRRQEDRTPRPLALKGTRSQSEPRTGEPTSDLSEPDRLGRIHLKHLVTLLRCAREHERADAQHQTTPNVDTQPSPLRGGARIRPRWSRWDQQPLNSLLNRQLRIRNRSTEEHTSRPSSTSLERAFRVSRSRIVPRNSYAAPQRQIRLIGKASDPSSPWLRTPLSSQGGSRPVCAPHGTHSQAARSRRSF